MKTTLIEQANRELSRSKRDLDRAKDAINEELRRINQTRAFDQCKLWSELYYAYPNSNQIKGYLAKVTKFTDAYPHHASALSALAAVVSDKAKATEEAKAGVEKARSETARLRAAKAADKGDNNLIAAMAGPRADYRVRCVESIKETIEFITAALAKHSYDISVAYPWPTRAVVEPFKARRMSDVRREAEVFFVSVEAVRSMHSPNIVALRENIEEVISDLADKLVAAHFDGYIYKLSKKIGKPIATATHAGSIWTDCLLTVICEDGETQVWHTKCIFNRSILNKIFNQWPTRRQS